MSKLVRLLIEEAGLSEQQARQVVRVLAVHAEDAVTWLGDELPDTVRPPSWANAVAVAHQRRRSRHES